MYGLAKLAAEEQDERSVAERAAFGAGGLAALGTSKDYVSGRKTLYHGTSKKNAEQIKQDGLLTAKGGTGAARVTDEYGEGSKGQVHATSVKPYAKFYANLADDKKGFREGFQSIMDAETTETHQQAMKSQSKNILTAPFLHDKKESEVLKVNMPYADYNKQFKVDEDGGINRYMAGKSSQDVDSKYIKGGANASLMNQLKETAGGLPKYIKNHPGRFGSGVGLAALGGGGLYQSVKPEEA